MKILVVLANPKEKCFTREACEIFCSEAARAGHEITLRDLYAMGFDPVASAADLRGNLTGQVADDVRIEQDLVRAADLIAFIHPIWWIDRPAILKGYVDRVFALGFAYGYGPNGTMGTLAGKSAIIISSAGSTAEHFRDSGKMEAIRIAQDVGTMEFCGLKLIRHLHFSPLGSRSTPEMVEGYRQQIRDLAASL